MFIVTAAMLACNCPIERRFWMITRSGHWIGILETVFTDKEWIPLRHFLSKSDREIFLATCLLHGITTHAPTNGADQSDEGSSGKKFVWHGQSFTLHISPELGQVFGIAYQFHPCSNYLFRRAEHG